MFDEKELRVLITSLDLTKKTLPFLENFGIENDDFMMSSKRLLKRCNELLLEVQAKAKMESEKRELLNLPKDVENKSGEAKG